MLGLIQPHFKTGLIDRKVSNMDSNSNRLFDTRVIHSSHANMAQAVVEMMDWFTTFLNKLADTL
jgi:hypothetical protein